MDRQIDHFYVFEGAHGGVTDPQFWVKVVYVDGHPDGEAVQPLQIFKTRAEAEALRDKLSAEHALP